MNRIFRLPRTAIIGLFLSILLLHNCKTADEVVPEPALQSQLNVRTFQIISIASRVELRDSYTASIAGESVVLHKTSDSTLTFIMPNVAAGEQQLSFEIGSLKYQVTKTVVADPIQTITTVDKDFDTDMATLTKDTAISAQEIADAKKFKEEVMQLYAGLTAIQKAEVGLFYEANKGLFLDFSTHLQNTLNGSTKFKTNQSECSRIDSKAFYDCTAENLSLAADALWKSTKSMAEWAAYAFIVSKVGFFSSPLAWGLTVTAATLTAGTATYFLLVEVLPNLKRFVAKLKPFLRAAWVLNTENMFSNFTVGFNSETEGDMGINATLATVDETNENVTPNVGRFTTVMNRLHGYWADFEKFLGPLPFFESRQVPVELTTAELVVSEISDPNIKLVSQQGEKLTFKSIYDKVTNFSFKVLVKKAGFIKEQFVSAVIEPAFAVKLTAQSMVKIKKDTDCYNAPLNMYYFTLNYLDPESKISSNLSNIKVEMEFEDNGCIAPWTLVAANDYFAEYSVSKTASSITIPSGVSLGDTQSKWAKVKIKFLDPNTGFAVSNTVEYLITRGVNYP
jgi:hypothetical protein